MQYQLSKHAQCTNLYYVTLVPLLLIPESVPALVLVLVSVLVSVLVPVLVSLLVGGFSKSVFIF